MSFEFCWEHCDCTRDCPVRDRRILFCWQFMRREGLRDENQCAPCSYRQLWQHGKLKLSELARTRERRGADRAAPRVLIIDDEPNILLALEETVRSLGLDCIAACDGEEALHIARDLQPELIITDVIMPKLNGVELCGLLKSDPRTQGIPVIMVTVRASDKEREGGQAAGADAYLVKPFQMEDLQAAISRFLPRKD